FFGLVLNYLRASDNIQYLSFGSRGLYAFLESFPYLLIVTLLLLVVVAGYIIKNSAFAYQRSFGSILIGLIVVIVLTGTVMAFTNVAEMIEEEAYGNRPTGLFFKPFFRHGMGQRRRGEAGIVLEAKGNLLVIQTPEGEHVLDISNIEKNELNILPGNFVVAIGERQLKVFVAEKIQVIEKEQMPMLMRGIRRHFKTFPGGMMNVPALVK
ncbi:MAG: hypothetical protein Q7S24_02090, partial [bacterium]|nr:hypothetical protein [bacterium]